LSESTLKLRRDPSVRRWRAALHEVIFEADTYAGKLFDILLIVCILISILATMADSIAPVHAGHGTALRRLEWLFTILFTIEYILRLLAVRRPVLYAKSFYGVVDLLGFLPTYISLLIPGSRFLRVIRVLRILRIFRILHLPRYVSAADLLWQALVSSRRKITVFLFTVLALVVILGSLMYMIEGEENGFTSIPQSIYWAIVTLTTVGYGDLSPNTPLGKVLASIIMIVGYGIIAVPTGIVTAEMVQASRGDFSTQACPVCSAEGHDKDAAFCKYCGARL
jgi:voltage-gated potassium channel